MSLWIKVIENGLCNDYEKKSKWTALSFISIGVITFIYTLFSAVTVSTIGASSLLITALFSLYYTSKENTNIAASWFKSLVYLTAAVGFFFMDSELLIHLSSLFFTLLALNSLFFVYLTRQNVTAIAWFFDILLSASFALYLFLNIETQISTAVIFFGIHLISEGAVLLFSGRRTFIRP